MKKKQHDPYFYYTLLIQHLEKMRETPFKRKAFIKMVRPFCKTSSVTENRIGLRLKGSNVGIQILIKENYFSIILNGSVHEFHFYVTTSKNLLSKLIRHNILTPYKIKY